MSVKTNERGSAPGALADLASSLAALITRGSGRQPVDGGKSDQRVPTPAPTPSSTPPPIFGEIER